MWKAILAGVLVFAVSVVPDMARAAPAEPIVKEDVQLYGLPIFTSDGVQIGAVAETGTDDNGHLVLLAELANPLGIGTETVAIPLELIMLHNDRINLLLTETEVSQRLLRNKGDGRETPLRR
jgi:PRC-barrel domain protein